MAQSSCPLSRVSWPSSPSRVSKTTSSPGATRATGSIAGCQRLCAAADEILTAARRSGSRRHGPRRSPRRSSCAERRAGAPRRSRRACSPESTGVTICAARPPYASSMAWKAGSSYACPAVVLDDLTAERELADDRLPAQVDRPLVSQRGDAGCERLLDDREGVVAGIVPPQGDPARTRRRRATPRARVRVAVIASRHPGRTRDERLAGESALDPSHAPVRPPVSASSDGTPAIPAASALRADLPQPADDAPGRRRRRPPLWIEPRTLGGARHLAVAAMSSPSQKNASYSACLNCRSRPSRRPTGTQRVAASNAAGSAAGGSPRRAPAPARRRCSSNRPAGGRRVPRAAAGAPVAARTGATRPRPPIVLGCLDGRRLHVRVRADDVVVEADCLHGWRAVCSTRGCAGRAEAGSTP